MNSIDLSMSLRIGAGGAKGAKAVLLPLVSLWLEGDSGVATTGSNVNTWTDQSSNAFVCNGVAAHLPTTSTAINGKPTVSGDGTQACTIPTAAWLGAKTIAIVAKLHSVPGASSFDSVMTLFDNGGTWSEVLLMNLAGYKNVTIEADFSSGNGVGYSPTLDTNPHEYLFTFDGAGSLPADYTAQLDGVTQTVAASSAISRSVGEIGSIFGRTNGTSITQGSPIDIAAVIVFKSVLSAGNQTLLHSYLNAKYGV